MDAARMISLGSLVIWTGVVCGVTGDSFTVAQIAEHEDESPEVIQELCDALAAEDLLYRQPWAGGKHYVGGDAAHALDLDIDDVVMEIDPYMGRILAQDRKAA